MRSVPVSLVQQRAPRAPTVHGLDGIEELTHAGMTQLTGEGTVMRAALGHIDGLPESD